MKRMRSLVVVVAVLGLAVVGGYALTRHDAPPRTATTTDCVARGTRWITSHLPAERRRLHERIRRESDPRLRHAYRAALRASYRSSATANAEYICGGVAVIASAPIWMR